MTLYLHLESVSKKKVSFTDLNINYNGIIRDREIGNKMVVTGGCWLLMWNEWERERETGECE